MINRSRTGARSRAACLAGAALMLGGCASHTVGVRNITPPSKALAAVCIEKPNVAYRLPIRISQQGVYVVTEDAKQKSSARAGEAVRTYIGHFEQALARELRANGVDAVSCDPAPRDQRDRISAYIRGAHVINTGLGQKTDLGIRVGLRPWSAQDHAWIADFSTGSMVASPSAPDAENVSAFAANIVGELRTSGWIQPK